MRRSFNTNLVAAETCILTFAFAQAPSLSQIPAILVMVLGVFAL
jgi:hypothetical protein